MVQLVDGVQWPAQRRPLRSHPERHNPPRGKRLDRCARDPVRPTKSPFSLCETFWSPCEERRNSPKEREHVDVPPRKDSTEQGPIKLALLRMSADARRGVGSFFSRE